MSVGYEKGIKNFYFFAQLNVFCNFVPDLENIKDEYRGLAIKEVIVPTIGEFETKDLLKALKLQ